MRLLIVFIVLMLVETSCGQNTFNGMVDGLISDKVKVITVDELIKKQDVILLDARELKEYNVSHLKGAIYCGYDNFKKNAISNLDKSKTIVVYCSVGYRSGKIGEKLQKLGFKNVLNLYGGIFDWINSGNKVYNQNGETIQIHGYDSNWGKWLRRGEKILN